MPETLVSRFGRLHGCPAGCPACARATAQLGIPERLRDWEEFVSSRDALRLVTLCDRSRKSLPQLSRDDVVQFCIEEALYDRLAVRKAAERVTEGITLDEPPGVVTPGINPAHADAVQRAREFAASGPRSQGLRG